MIADPDNDTVRLQFYARLAETEMVLLLDAPAEGDRISPALFDVDGAQFALIFDNEDRLAAFAERQVPVAGLSGRALARMLAGQGIGLGLNLQVAPSEMLIPADAVDWLAATLGHGPTEAEARIDAVHPPSGLPEAVLTALDRKLATAAGLARLAYLAGVTFTGGVRGHVLAIVDPVPGAETALAAGIGEALTFSGVEAGQLDVLFLRPSDPLAARLARVGLRFDLPEPEAAPAPSAPGMDPDRPPRLR